jgi:hypothetical protein
MTTHSPASRTATSAIIEQIDLIVSTGSRFRLSLNLIGNVYGDWGFREQLAKSVTNNVYLAGSMDDAK